MILSSSCHAGASYIETATFYLIHQGSTERLIANRDRKDNVLWQAKANDVWPDCNHYKLLSRRHISHGRGLVFAVGGKVPQGFSVALIDRHKVSGRIPIE